jgi:DNA-binding IclR family transcriptional regulator
MDRANEEIEELFREKQLTAFTSKTITDIPSLLHDIEGARKKGWTYDDEEYEDDVRCIGAPIYDYRDNTIAAVSTAWHAHNKNQKIADAAELLVKAAAEISKRMGYRPH